MMKMYQVHRINTAIADLPSWRVGDRWIYDGYLDVGDFIEFIWSFDECPISDWYVG